MLFLKYFAKFQNIYKKSYSFYLFYCTKLTKSRASTWPSNSVGTQTRLGTKMGRQEWVHKHTK